MKVTINNKDYYVKFAHQMTAEKNKKKRRFITACWISDTNYSLLTKGFAKLNPIDKLNRNMGKARAFSKALSSFNREERKVFWEHFNTTFAIGKEK
jgi:hypothetical protein